MAANKLFRESDQKECLELIKKAKEFGLTKESERLEGFYVTLNDDTFSDVFCGTAYIATLHEYLDYAKEVKEKLKNT